MNSRTTKAVIMEKWVVATSTWQKNTVRNALTLWRQRTIDYKVFTDGFGFSFTQLM